MSDYTVNLTDSNFADQALGNTLPVIVDFWAAWCGPCKMLTPIIDEIGKDLAGSVVIGKLNVDENPAVAGRYGVTSLPSLLFIKGGQVLEQHTGLLAGKPLRDKIRRVFQLAS